MNTTTLFILFFLVSLVSAGLVQNLRVKRQWGGWEGPGGGWQQNNFNNFRNKNNIAAQQNQYNCQTSGINLIGLPISSYNCQNSGMSAQVKTLQSGQQSQGVMQGPLGGILNNFMG
ncbi:unnamed protein product [Caenorhabditis sp. 36 PRJEB53466]|nr:unnamed protein product [Caenorhabditis sp. 36 PRJEB53466]